jgi:copper transport protein
MRRWNRHRAAALAAVTIAMLAAPATAEAHAVLTGSTPADGASLAASPHTVRLTFSEAVAARLSTATLLDTRGRPVAGIRVRPDGENALRVALPSLRTGAYRLVWRTVAADDLHATEGSIVFGLGAPASAAVAAPAAATAGPDRVESALRGLDLAALATALGALAVLLLCLPRMAGAAAAEGAVRATRRLVVGGSALALLTGVAVVVESGLAAGIRSPGSLLQRVVLGTTFGQRFAVRELLFIGLLAAVVLARGHQRTWRVLTVVGATGMGRSRMRARDTPRRCSRLRASRRR